MVTTPQTYIEALEALVASEKEKERIKKERLAFQQRVIAQAEVIEKKEAVIEEQQPKVAVADKFLATVGDYSIKEIADMLDWFDAFRDKYPFKQYGQNNVFEVLRREGILIRTGREKNLPYEEYVKYFNVRAYTDSRHKPQVRVNAEGVKWLMNRFDLKHRNQK